jgi:hypothetical protein
MIIGKQLFDSYEDERLFSTGNDELDDILEEVYYSGIEDGYDYAQYEFAETDAEGTKWVKELHSPRKLQTKEGAKVAKRRLKNENKANRRENIRGLYKDSEDYGRDLHRNSILREEARNIHRTADNAVDKALPVVDREAGRIHGTIDRAGGRIHNSLDSEAGRIHKSLDSEAGRIHNSLDSEAGRIHKSLDSAFDKGLGYVDRASGRVHETFRRTIPEHLERQTKEVLGAGDRFGERFNKRYDKWLDTVKENEKDRRREGFTKKVLAHREERRKLRNEDRANKREYKARMKGR